MTATKAVTDHDNGMGGNAPCMDTYIAAWGDNNIGMDPHAVHGMVANDGGFVAVGEGIFNDAFNKGFVIKSKGSSTCTPTDGY